LYFINLDRCVSMRVNQSLLLCYRVSNDSYPRKSATALRTTLNHRLPTVHGSLYNRLLSGAGIWIMRKVGIVELEAAMAVARRRSFRAASAELGVSRTALSQMIAGLEARLGVRLFNRTTRSVSPTHAGEQFLAEIAPAVGAINHAVETVNTHRDKPVGSLRINSSVGAARRILSRIILEFVRLYPEMQVDLVTEDRPIDIVADGFDAGVRPGDAVPADMIAVHLEPIQGSAVVGSPAYFKGRAAPETPQDLLHHTCIRARMPSGSMYRWEFQQDGRMFTLDVPGRLTLDEASLTLEAALDGIGLAYLSDWWIDKSVRAGKLRRVLDGFIPSSAGLCLYYPSRRHQPAGLRALISFIQDTCRTGRVKSP
jgi:DNA-binding transcriptional LysR family regulator